MLSSEYTPHNYICNLRRITIQIFPIRLPTSLAKMALHNFQPNSPPLPQTKCDTVLRFQTSFLFPRTPQHQPLKCSNSTPPLLLSKSPINSQTSPTTYNNNNYYDTTSVTTKQQDTQININNNNKQLPQVWKEIHGEHDWVGLLDPMDPLFRSELIRYGEMAQACYDAFDYDPYSKYCGSCRFTRQNFFNSLGLSPTHGYDVTRYLYATTNINLPNFFKKSRWPKVWSKSANWMGYVAVSNDQTTKLLGRRDITIAWRGTVTRLEWIADLMDYLKPIKGNKIPSPDKTVKVEAGFVDLYTDKDANCRYCEYSARERILTEIKRLKETYSNEELSITITGHSLGAALGLISAYDVVETGIHLLRDGGAIPVCVFSYSGPRVGNVRFKERMEGLGVKVLRVVNVNDVVPKTPGFLFNEGINPVIMKFIEGLPWCYSHVGEQLALDHRNSPFLKDTADPVCAHNLEALLHLLDGYNGKGNKFVLASERDPALVNKASDFLKDHYMVPPYWRQDENKGMVRNKDGRWMQPDRPKLDDHPSDMSHHLKQLGPGFKSSTRSRYSL